ncbi:hypothetical protein MACJ_001509 [Theileria orientalis]|uniref:Uncharacterized protein n=1 Tax=Theileria orientalis TaxID=68886 RepID=A0A976M8R9_THEOR|nr:hypothetical protein MACJ_001509 [Theileria orientalis]
MFYRLLSSSVQFASCDNLDPKRKKDSQSGSWDKKYAVDVDIGDLSLYDLKNMVEETAKSVELLMLLINLKIENMELKEAARKRPNLRRVRFKESEGSTETRETDGSIEMQKLGEPIDPHGAGQSNIGEFVDEPNEDEKPDGEVVSTSVYRMDNGGNKETVIVQEYKKRRRPKNPVTN